MVDVTYLGLSAVGWHVMIKNWWDKVVISFLLFSVVFFGLYMSYRLYNTIRRWQKSRSQRSTLPTPIARYFKNLNPDSSLALVKSNTSSSEKVKDLLSFGVYLGRFSTSPTAAEARLLSQWDVVVLDPFQAGVLDAVSASLSQHKLARLNVQELVKPENASGSPSNDEVLRALEVVNQILTVHLRGRRFTGVLMAEFRTLFQPRVVNELAKYMQSLGLDLWLETPSTDCLNERECHDIEFKLIGGVVFRNGTIRIDGDRQNFFQMQEMRTAQRGIAAQRVPHGPPLMLWETIDDASQLQYAVVQRSFNWCTYNSALCWVGHAAALTDAEVAASESVAERPLGALMWLKGEQNMKAHDRWRENNQISPESCGHDALYDSLNSFIPNLASRLRLTSSDSQQLQLLSAGDVISSIGGESTNYDYSLTDPLTQSSVGDDLSGLGCFHLGLEANTGALAKLLDTQRHLKELDLLLRIDAEELRQYGAKMRSALDAHGLHTLSPSLAQSVKELANLLTTMYNDGGSLRVYTGLHSGLQTGPGVQFWGMHDHDVGSGVLHIYISNKTPDRAGTILHTYLSSRGFKRDECFMAEQAISENMGNLSELWQLPPRIVYDVEHLSPEETILFLQRLTLLRPEIDSSFLAKIRSCCEYQLMDIPTLTQLRTQNAEAYLQGTVSGEQVIMSRLAWHKQRGFLHPEPSAVISLMEEVDTRLYQILMNGESELYEKIGLVVQSITNAGQVDAGADILALAVFCAFRKQSSEEIGLEILDRNPYPNHTTVQAANFAENFALGSRCESFFDLTPMQLGRILAARYRQYYMKYQPPMREEGFTELPTTYAAMQIDLDPAEGPGKAPAYYRVTFLGIFALPALFDIMMLTTIGRGLYLTTYMTDDQKTMATTALMLALLACGGVGSWISSGGSYYLYANAFPAMNMFVLTRFVAGVAISILAGLGGMIAVMVTRGVTDGLVFIFYFVMLTTYLTCLSALSIYQLPGSSFQSGRSVIITRIPILFISPIVTLFVKHDIAVYPCVLTCFLVSLLLGARSTMSKWATWYLNIPSVSDKEVVNWYIEREQKSNSGLQLIYNDVATTTFPRQALNAAVLKEANRHFWQKKTTDPLVLKLATGYESTMFLMNWYCKHKRTRMPLLYSSTWNLTLKAGLENMTNMQKGLKLHSAFLHWRHTGGDIASAILYFVVALLDKWAALISGGALVGLSAASSTQFRLSVGFGLCYYLMGAVSLDAVSQPLWTAANQNTVQPIVSMDSLREISINDKVARRTLYWRSLGKFFLLHLWGVAVTSALMWAFEDSRDATIMYLAYIGAYTGLLWFQYNKIYCGFESHKSLIVAVVIALPIGIALHMKLPHFPYSGVISLSIGTWIACIHSIWLSKIGLPTFVKSAPVDEVEYEENIDVANVGVSYSCSGLEPQPILSQATLSKQFNAALRVPTEQRYRLEPAQHPASMILDILRNRSQSGMNESLEAAFPSGSELLARTAALWQNGRTVIELVSARNLPAQETKMRNICRKTDDGLHIFVILKTDPSEGQWNMNIERNCNIIAESLVQASCEMHLGLSHDHSILAELLAVENNGSDELSLPEGVRQTLESSSAERARLISIGNRTLLRYFLLGLDCEREWDLQPTEVRAFLLKRCCGRFEPLSPTEHEWIRSRLCKTDNVNTEDFMARCNLGANLTVAIDTYAKALDANSETAYDDVVPMSPYGQTFGFNTNNEADLKVTRFQKFSLALKNFGQGVSECLKFLIISLVADADYQRELDYMLRSKPLFIHWPVTFFLNSIWKFVKTLQNVIIPLVLFYKRPNIARLREQIKGTKTVVGKKRIIIESFSGPSTGFMITESDGTSRLSQYKGTHEQQPSDAKDLMAINTYTDKLTLREREEYSGHRLVNQFSYEYAMNGRKSGKMPIQRECLKGELKGQVVHYDERGYISTGSTFINQDPVDFTYWYRKAAKFEDELLRGEYVLPHITIRVNWSMPPRNHPKRLDEWLPYTKITEATFIKGPDVYHATWDYEHKFHPDIDTTLNGKPIPTPAMIEEDWFHVLDKPQKCGFLSDNPLLSFSSAKPRILSRMLGLNVKRYPMPTSHARTKLWKTWKGGRELDAITSRFLDEDLLRHDSVLDKYWLCRDMGMLEAAKTYLDVHADTVMARVDVDPDISSWVHIAFKISDFYSFGQGGDSRINTRTLQSQIRDSEDELHILAMDTSTWPNEPGGVSACRRDMVNDLKTIKWHIVAESANDYGVPRFQIERNVQSLTILPLWGLDFMNPTHGVLENSLDSAVVQKSFDTRTADIKENFLPILTSLVKCSRTRNIKRQHIEEATQALVDLNTYFESTRNWNDVWSSKIVKQTWRELWLTETMEDTLLVSEWWNFEKPTLQQLDLALDMWHRYLFIFSLPVPERIPDVFQASHHFTGATYGIVCKIKRNCTLHVWDHCISFRELTTFMSSAVSFDVPFVNSSLISLGYLGTILLEHHADVVLPCAAYFNPGWEVELGSSEGAIEHRRTVARKIDPVVNGISNMEKFEPIKEIKTDKPTAVMLSHVQYVKDIKNAIMATDLIVNKWGFTDYRLHIYGDLERAAGHATECQELIASKGLTDSCVLKGLGNPSVVLQDAWLFLNSSISEGLPLAMGEAALTGVPVVCTDVGASFCVVTDIETGAAFSEVVPPNDSESLARAQISIMGLLGKWTGFAEDAPGVSAPILAYPNPSPQQVSDITQRMYDKQEQRRKLGMKGRDNVLKNFSSDRYLREHEQMLWIGKHRSPSNNFRSTGMPLSSAASSVWFGHEKHGVHSSASSIRTPRNPRLTPESWISLSSTLEKKGMLSSATTEIGISQSSSENTLKEWMRLRSQKRLTSGSDNSV